MEYIAFPKLADIARHSILRTDFEVSVRQAAALMEAEGVSSVVIEQGHERFVFSIEELMAHIHANGDMDHHLSAFALPRIVCVNGDRPVLTALEQLEQSGQRYVGVVDDADCMTGIVSHTDILSSIDPTVLMERKTVGDLVWRAPPPTFTADWILEDVLHHFRKMEDAVIVVEGVQPIGIITTRDVFNLLAADADLSQPLAHYMVSPVVTTRRDSSIHDTLMQIQKLHFKRAIVVDEGGRLVGVVSQSELIGFAYGSWVNILKHHTTELHELVEMLKEKNKTLELLSYTDALTDLGNKRMFYQEMEREVERIVRYDSPSFSMVLVDIDLFKRVNDTYGHIVGDQVLQQVAAKLKDAIRKSDTVVRWGGEEFAILLRNTPLESAREFAERFRGEIARTQLLPDHELTVSAGVGEYRASEREDLFFERIDRALYQAKTAGRNAVRVSAG
ncbi:MAG: diguanylate cyclase [Pseudomonadota bacterium]